MALVLAYHQAVLHHSQKLYHHSVDVVPSSLLEADQDGVHLIERDELAHKRKNPAIEHALEDDAEVYGEFIEDLKMIFD